MRGVTLALILAWPLSAAGAAPKVSASAGALLLGEGGEVELTVVSDNGPLHGVAAVGALTRVGASNDRTVKYRWRPPDIRYPMIAVLAFWSELDSANDVAVLRIPLIGRTDLKIATEPRAMVTVELQDRVFGPVRADRRGRASVPIEVPPNVRHARVLVDAGGNRSTREVPIDVPDTAPVAAAFAEPSFAHDEANWLIIAHALPGWDDGRISVQGGTATLADQAGQVLLYRVKAEPGSIGVVAAVALNGFELEARSTVRAPPAVTPSEPAPTPPAAPVAPLKTTSRTAGFVGLGGFSFGGANLGPALVGGGSIQLATTELAFELEGGVRFAGVSSVVPGLGELRSRLWVFPVAFGARYPLLRAAELTLDARVGGGVVVFNHRLSSDFQAAHSELGIRPELFAALNLRFGTHGALEPFAEVRAEWNQIRTPTLFARPGGIVLLFGTRWPSP